MKTTPIFVEAICKAAQNHSNHGYKHSAGMSCARQAIAKRHSRISKRNVEEGDVIITSGCSGALEIAIKGIASAGDNILVPVPGFSIYETIAKSNGIDVRHYPLVPERQWEADIEKLESLIDERTRVILLNNPSNPCGSVYTKAHLEQILAVAEKHKLPIIADEIYGNLVFEGNEFFPLASLTSSVPVIEVGGVAKEFLAPGFRVGWIIIHDVPSSQDGLKALHHVREGLFSLTQVIVGSNTLVQAALPSILDPPAGSSEEQELQKFQALTIAQLQENANFVATRLGSVKGLNVIVPQGAMYVMVGLSPELSAKMDDVEFSQKLMDAELVFVLPGACFGLKNFFRIVYCAPKEILSEACDRIETFCKDL
mmetsp:Transcript_7577/g.12223  ORF Transcript_7577/g.12223 Transcript_7577/m.12223 type:complete len:369 (-) Transcript_7577:26-1132(-)